MDRAVQAGFVVPNFDNADAALAALEYALKGASTVVGPRHSVARSRIFCHGSQSIAGSDTSDAVYSTKWATVICTKLFV